MKSPDIIFSRSNVAEILNCTVLTIANREKAGTYPQPRRDPKNNYRIYTLSDIFHLQEKTFGQIYYGPLLAALWDLGYRDATECDAIIKKARSEYNGKS